MQWVGGGWVAGFRCSGCGSWWRGWTGAVIQGSLWRTRRQWHNHHRYRMWLSKAARDPTFYSLSSLSRSERTKGNSSHQMFLMFSCRENSLSTGHNQQERTQVQGYEGPGEYKAGLEYHDAEGNPLLIEQVAAYSKASAECSQFISWECFSAGIHHPRRVCSTRLGHSWSKTQRNVRSPVCMKWNSSASILQI